ncbi:hypothetical protein [Nitrososphaera sp.]|uniref:hypothetical protein n=1 Tax=Nitrososphaera sp. TaxID=1971748 RepID=UPI003171922E
MLLQAPRRPDRLGLYTAGAGLGVMLVDAVMSQTRCRKFLAGDGITTLDFTVSEFGGAFGGVSIDARAAKKSSQAFADAFSVAKNLDEYQYRICALVPSLADSPAKTLLQKYRVAIAAAFAKLVHLIKHEQGGLQAWTAHARLVLVEASDAYVAVAAGPARLQKPKITDALLFFGLAESDVDRALASAYGQ